MIVPRRTQQTSQNQTGNAVPAQQKQPVSQTVRNRDINMDQIIRIDGGRGHFVELTKAAMGLHDKNAEGKLRMNFVSYDTNTHKQTAFCSFYFSFSEWDVLYHQVIHEEDEFAQHWLDALNSQDQYATILPPMYKGSMGNGQIVSRVFSLVPGQKEGLIFVRATQGPGKQSGQGLIQPAGKPTVNIGVPIKYEDLVALLRAGDKEIQAYKSALAVKSMGTTSSVSSPVVQKATNSAPASADTSALEVKIDSLQQQVAQLTAEIQKMSSMIE